MDTSPPDLLALPRELRDRVYGYLTRQIDFDWNRGDILTLRGSLGDVQIIEPVPVRLINCPLPHVFRIHSRIYEEYRELCMKGLEAIIDPSLHTLEKPLFDPMPESDARAEAALGHLRHLTIFLKLHARTTSKNLDWQNQLNLLQAVTAKAPNLATLRVAVRQQYHLNSPTFDDPDVPSVLVPASKRLKDAETTPFLPDVPTSLGSMSMVQRGEGYHVGYALTYKHFQVIQPLVPTYTIAGCAYSISHGIRKIGIYTFAREDEHYIKRLWTEEEVIAKWPMRKYPRQAIENVSSDRAALLTRLPFELTEWAERKGMEEVKRWV
jgi:hypothetical protein